MAAKKKNPNFLPNPFGHDEGAARRRRAIANAAASVYRAATGGGSGANTPPHGRQVEVARGGMYMGQGRSPITTYGTGVTAPGPYRNTTDPDRAGRNRRRKAAENPGPVLGPPAPKAPTAKRPKPKPGGYPRPKNPPRLPGTR